MNKFEQVKAELLAELEIKKAINIADEIDEKVAEYKATITANAKAEKLAAITETERDIECVERLFAKEQARLDAIVPEPIEEIPAEEIPADKLAEV